MAGSTTSRQIWALVERQHGVIARRQLLALGLSEKAIEHRVARRRLRPIFRGVYEVGRGGLTRLGWWMAAVLACGPDAFLSHKSAAALWKLRREGAGPIHVSLPRREDGRRPGIRVHRRSNLRAEDRATRHGIPVTSPVCTIVDIAPTLGRAALEAIVNEADKLDLVHVPELRAAVAAMPRRPGLKAVRALLDETTFSLTDSDLERRFLALALRAGLPKPQTQAIVEGYTVDFYWPELRLVVETDGLRYHRTPAQQKRDRLRDQAYAAAGLTPLRFTHGQIAYERAYVERTLARTATARARAGRAGRDARTPPGSPRARAASA
jgi:very-short-patch-repair endonuclease